MIALNLESAHALFDRAKTHEAAYRRMTGRTLWNICERYDDVTNEWSYSLDLNRESLVACKPVLGDCANNLNSVLDNVISAMARAHGTTRNNSPYYPLSIDLQEFHEKLDAMVPKIGQAMVDAIADNHAINIQEVPHMFAVKKMANTAKHWEILPAHASAHAVAINDMDGNQTIFQIPPNTFQSVDAYEYHRSRQRLPQTSHSIAISLEILGLGNNIQNGPDTSLECANRYLEGLLKTAKDVAL